MSWPFHSSHGWHHIAKINTLLTLLLAILLLSLLAYTVSRSRLAYTILYLGSCNTAQTTDLWLHLLINVLCSGILASSNFFMHILSSPTRGEIDRAHAKGVSLCVGMQSQRNLFHLPKRKAILYPIFFLSSLPIHLFFNSAVFSTTFIRSNWHMTFASEDFINGANYSLPGAPLITPEVMSIYYGCSDAFTDDRINCDYAGSMGDITSPTSRASQATRYAADNSPNWNRLDVPSCLSKYVYCSERQQVGNVVFVLKSPAWKSTTLYPNMSQSDIKSWEKYTPVTSPNPLWFTTNCTSIGDFTDPTICHNTCSDIFRQLNNDQPEWEFKSADLIPPTYKFDFFKLDSTDYINTNIYNTSHVHWPTFAASNFPTLELDYCLAEPLPDQCKVMLSNTMVLIVTICVIVKTLICAIVLYTIPNEHPLAVQGDVIASFIRRPDKATIGRAYLDKTMLKHPIKAGVPILTRPPHPWKTKTRRWVSAIGYPAFFRGYSVFLVDVGILVVSLAISIPKSPPTSTKNVLDPWSHRFYETGSPDFLIPLTLTANAPQLLLSFSYFVYNSLLTRLCAEKEWYSYSRDYLPLRVTEPKGAQRSTYRLQLPYKYSIILITISIGLHWIISNVLFISAFEGGFFDNDFVSDKYIPGFAVGTSITAVYSTQMTLAIFVITVVLIPIPLILSLRRAKGPMPRGSTDSIVIAAACHVPILDDESDTAANSQKSEKSVDGQRSETSNDFTNDKKSQPYNDFTDQKSPTQESAEEKSPTQRSAEEKPQNQDSTDQKSHTPDSTDDKQLTKRKRETSLAQKQDYLNRVAQGFVRWGDVKDGTDTSVRHLSFGTRGHGVRDPVDGQLYW